jgi:tetratricopeptide (TPR) repeat protein
LGLLDEWDLAHAAFLQATEHDPTFAEAWAFLGEANQQLGESGLTDLEVAWALDPDSLSANILLSLYWQRQNEMEDALFYLEYAAKLAPINPALQADLGSLYLRMGDLAAALEHYQRATQISSQEPRYWVLLATFSVEHEVYLEEAGLPAALRAYELAPQDAAVSVLLGRAYFLLGDYVNAGDFYLNALAINPDYAPAHLHLGLLYLALDNRPAAQQEFQLAMQLDPEGQTAMFARKLLAQHFP